MKKKWFTLILFFMIISFVYALPQLVFNLPTPENSSSTTNTSIEINVSIIEENLQNLTYNWNGTNFTIYNNSLKVMFNFENFSSLGETNTKVVDLTDGVDNATVAGAIWTPEGRYGGAYTFNTTNSLSISNQAYLKPPLYFSFWMKSAPENSTGWLFVKYGGAGYSWDGWGIITSSDNRLGIWLNGNSQDNYFYSTEQFDQGWNHVYAEVKNNGVNKLYLNGNLVVEQTDSNTVYNEAVNLGIGNGFNGTIDEVRIWNRSLSTEEIYEQYVSNLKKINSTQWYLYVNQSKNVTNGLDVGTYTYQAFSSNGVSSNSTDLRTLDIVSNISRILLDWIYPTSNINVSRGGGFNIIVDVTCLGDDCGEINVSLDPISGSSDSLTDDWAMRGKNLRQTGYTLSNVPENISNTNVSIYDSGNSYIRNTPAIANGYLYVLGDSLDRLNATNLSQVFETYPFSTSYSYGSPTVTNDYAYFTSSGGTLYQVNSTNVSQEIATFNLGGSSRSNPVVYNNTLYIQANGFVFQLNATNISQEIARKTGSDVYDYASVAIDDGYVYAVIGSYLYQLDVNNVSITYNTFNTGGLFWYGAPVVDTQNKFIYLISHNRYVFQLNSTNITQEIARYDLGSTSTYSPQVVLGNGYIYFGSYDRNIYQLNASNVSQAIAISLKDNSFIANYPLVTSEYVFFPNTNQGMLYQVNASNISQEIGRYDIPAQTFGVSAAYGYIYVGSNQYVYRLGEYETYSEQTKGLISITEGATPFYTNVSNPYTINLSSGESQIITWWVNATGDLNSTYEFFIYANKTSNTSISNISSKLNITILTEPSCIPSLTNTSWSSWVNQTSCQINDLILQNRSLTQYDENFCGEIGNTTFEDYQNVSCSYKLIDEDLDGVLDTDDNLNGNSSSVNSTGITELNITVGGNSTNGTFSDSQEVLLYDSSNLIINFTHNFSQTNFNLSKVTIIKAENSLIVNLSGQLQNKKSIYIEDNNFASLCVKDADIISISEMNTNCDGTNETDFTSCLGNSTGISLNNLTCTDSGNTIRIDNLSFSAIRGVPAVTTTPSSSGGGGGSSRYTPKFEQCVENWECNSWSFCSANYTQERKCNDLNKCNTSFNKPEEIRQCVDILFDSLVELDNKKIYPWSDLKFSVSLKEVNQFDLVDIKVLYRISKNQEVVYEESETKAISDILNYEKKISDLDLAPGEYSLYVLLEYGKNQVSSSEQNFVVIGSKTFWIYGIIILVILILIYALFRTKKRELDVEKKLEEIESRLISSKDKKENGGWWINKVEDLRLKSLERRKKKLLDSEDILTDVIRSKSIESDKIQYIKRIINNRIILAKDILEKIRSKKTILKATLIRKTKSYKKRFIKWKKKEFSKKDVIGEIDKKVKKSKNKRKHGQVKDSDDLIKELR